MSALDQLPNSVRHAVLVLARSCEAEQTAAPIDAQLRAEIAQRGGAQAVLDADRGTDREVFTSMTRIRERFFPNAEDCPACGGDGVKPSRWKVAA